MTARDRAEVRRRARGRCEYCRLPDFAMAPHDFHVEQVIARKLDGARILGLTAVGRTTVWLLEMNSEVLLSLRASLMSEGRW